jgi:1-acyl-sn-glycerol-3-phosphate acyltransferase
MGRLGSTLVSRLTEAYCWACLLGNTGVFYGRARLTEPFRGPAAWNDDLHRWAMWAMRLGFYDLRVDGAKTPEGPAIYVANHRSVFDIAVLSAVLPPPVHFVARDSLFRAPVIGSVLHHGRHVLVPRGAGAAGAQETARQVIDRLADGGRVVFFPEGTRSTDGRVGAFASGAFRLAHRAIVPVVPVALCGTEHVIPKGSRSIRGGRIDVRVGEPLPVDTAAPTLRDEAKRWIETAVCDLETARSPEAISGRAG